MSFEDFQTKDSVVIVYTGEGKGKTSASLGLLARGLGNRWHLSSLLNTGVLANIHLSEISNHCIRINYIFIKVAKASLVLAI